MLKDVMVMSSKVVKPASCICYQKVINDLDKANIFSNVKWLMSVQQYTIPPIQYSNGSLAILN